MSEPDMKVLLVEDNPGDARLVESALAQSRTDRFDVRTVTRLADAVEALERGAFDAILLDLSLPDCAPADTVKRVAALAPQSPIVVLTGLDDEQLSRELVRRGAQDCLPKGAFDDRLLIRSLHYAVERKRAQLELAVARDEALASASARSAFLANMSHEIRTPASAIIGATRMLMDTPLSAEQREFADAVWTSARSLLEVINQILDFSKASSGKLRLEETELHPAAVLESVVQLLAERVRDSAVEITSYVDGEVPVQVRGDPARLRQVLVNLVGNAVKFTERGEVAVSLRRQAIADDEVTLQFMVRDSGIGIPREIQSQLFEAFYQGDPSMTRRYGGTGLGLAIAAQLVELMGGRVGVESVMGQGSTFWFSARVKRAPGAFKTEAELHNPLAGRRVLVADTSPINARALRAQLAAWGVECDTVISVPDAVAFMRRATNDGHRYDAVLLGTRLGEPDDVNWSELIRAQPAFTQQPLVLMCEFGHAPRDSEMRAARVAGWVAKPIRQSQLSERLTVAVGAGAAPSAPPPVLAGSGRARQTADDNVSEQVRRDARILVVEDHPLNKMVVLKMLDRLGYRADAVLNGREALEAVRRTPYDIIFMDCQMPEMDGYEATRRIRREPSLPHRPVIVGLTAHALQGDRRKCLDAGMDAYLAKPVLPEDLSDMLARWLVGARVRDRGEDDVERSAAAPIDPIAIGRLLAGEDDKGGYFNEVIGVFLSDLDQRVASAKAAAGSGDAAGLAAQAHALRGSCGHFGARPMMALCAEIERRARGGALEEIGQIVEALEREAARVRVALETQRKQLSGPEPGGDAKQVGQNEARSDSAR
jgi:two-component system, sensor histidine kinase and response regulator